MAWSTEFIGVIGVEVHAKTLREQQLSSRRVGNQVGPREKHDIAFDHFVEVDLDSGPVESNHVTSLVRSVGLRSELPNVLHIRH